MGPVAGGLAAVENEAKEFLSAGEKFDRGEEKVARNQSSERAIVQTQTMGFLTETEGTELLLKSDKPVEEKTITSHVESLKGRATSRPRIHGFEPLLEDAEEASSIKIPTIVAQKGEDKVHGERKSRAVKRERHTGVGPTLEKAEPLLTAVATQEEVKESVLKELLTRATPSETKLSFLPLAPAPLSSGGEDKLDAGTGSKDSKDDSTPKEMIHPSQEEPAAEITDWEKKETLTVKKKKIKEKERKDSSGLVPVETELPLEDVAVHQMEEQTQEQLAKSASGDSPDDTLLKTSNKASKIETKQQKSKKTDKAEINVESDGTFLKPKLKKSEAVKRQVEESKLEKVQLKHHEFENEPQTPVDEEKTNIKISTPLSLSMDNTENQRTKTKIKKTKKKTKTDEVDKSMPGLNDMDLEERSEIGKENWMPKVLSPLLTEKESSPDSEVETMEFDGNSETRLSPDPEPDQLKVAKKEFKSISNASNLVEEVEAMEEGKEFEKGPKQPEKANVSQDDFSGLTPSTNLAKVSVKQKKSRKKEAQAELKREEDGTYEIPELRKSEVIKRPIPEAELEEVDLRHHEFENEPQTPAEELPSNLVTTGNPLSINMEGEEEETKKRKVVVKKKT